MVAQNGSRRLVSCCRALRPNAKSSLRLTPPGTARPGGGSCQQGSCLGVAAPRCIIFCPFFPFSSLSRAPLASCPTQTGQGRCNQGTRATLFLLRRVTNPLLNILERGPLRPAQLQHCTNKLRQNTETDSNVCANGNKLAIPITPANPAALHCRPRPHLIPNQPRHVSRPDLLGPVIADRRRVIRGAQDSNEALQLAYPPGSFVSRAKTFFPRSQPQSQRLWGRHPFIAHTHTDTPATAHRT